MSVGDEGNADALAALADRIATELLSEFGLDGVIVKLHLGHHAASCGVTAKERTNPKLDDIVLGEIGAMTDYASRVFGARELSGETHLPQPDGTHVVALTGEGKTGST